MRFEAGVCTDTSVCHFAALVFDRLLVSFPLPPHSPVPELRALFALNPRSPVVEPLACITLRDRWKEAGRELSVYEHTTFGSITLLHHSDTGRSHSTSTGRSSMSGSASMYSGR